MTFWRSVAALLVVVACLGGCAEVRDLMRPPEPVSDDASSVPASLAEDYRLGVGDVISIRVYDWRAGAGTTAGDDDLRLEKIRLDHTGVVSMPFGQFKAVGLSVKDLEAAVIASLSGRILKSPRVWINIEEYRPFFVEGQVTRPGAYPYQPGLNVRKAVTIGGGFRERASLEKIFVVREGDKSQARVRVNLNSVVGPGDTLTVEESFF